MTMLRRSHVMVLGLGLLLSLVACAKSEPPCTGERLQPGHEITQQVWGDRCDFDFEGKAGEAITLKIVSKTPGLDPRVQLLDPDGQEEASDDDSGGKGNPLIKGHVLKRSGLYTVSIGSADGQSGELSVLLVPSP
jgi:hypothetical protein